MAKVTTEGIQEKTYTEYLTDIQVKWKDVFGEDFTFDPETPQGQITSLEALELVSAESAILNVARSMDVLQCGGQQLDDLFNLLSVFRRGATKSTVSCTLAGENGTIIPAGSIVQMDSGTRFLSNTQVLIGSSGTEIADFTCAEEGNIAVPAGSVTKIITPIAGWHTVNNVFAGTAGRDVENDSQYTERYFNELFTISNSMMESIESAIYKLDDVISLSYKENVSNTDATMDGAFVPAHGFTFAVQGGGASDIAEAIRKSKSAGSDTRQNVPIKLVGAQNTVIPAGTRVSGTKDSITYVFSLKESVTLTTLVSGSDYTATGNFVCDSDGQLDLAIGDVDTIVDAVAGLNSITNESAIRFVSVLIDVWNQNNTFVTQSIPINFLRVEEIPLTIEISTAPHAGVFPPDGIQQIKDNIVAYFKGFDYETQDFEFDGIKVGEDVYKARLYTPINMVKGHDVTDIVMKIKGESTDLSKAVMNMYQLATIEDADITVATS